MVRGSKRKAWLIGSAAVLIVLLLAYAENKGLLLDFYIAGAAELRLVHRGNPPVRIRFSSRDGMNQVYIPAGEFIMGSNDDAYLETTSMHTEYLDAYWIDQLEVTNAMYALCYQSGECTHTAHYDTYLDDPAYANYPVHYISWFAAEAFCAWEGGRLPTEAEWEKAARGVNGLRFPWGNAKPDNSLLNFNGYYQVPRSAYEYLTGISPYGLMNMGGNVQEWVADWYSPDYYSNSPYKNPTGPASGELKVLRGGGYWDGITQVQTFYRFKHDPTSAGEHRGVRCVQDVQ